ncbi:B-cell receptor CD22-like isoform X3 [Hippoglossus hippoglossus]|uniref:B-cell receptor CD22-like isoform X3 n=1 Tax=Hippoglossus hippoglossus TaxID=8267 RepID=UPI00148B764C|nr:B-cell receptor CD22-like isoform X3 [Hippoglossus hippoglossus]
MESWMLMILVIMPGVWSGEWSVTFEDQCALRGGSVVMKCSYNYPRSQRVTQVDWSRALFTSGRGRLHHLSSLPSPPDFEYVGNRNGNCSLKINNVQPTDQGQYYFSFVTTLDRWTSKSHAYLYVKDAPKRVTLSLSPPGDVVKGSSVTFNCSSDANPPVRDRGYSLYMDGQFISSGQEHTISDLQPRHSGLYHCQACNNVSWRGDDLMNSTDFHLDVLYGPMNMSILVDDQQFAEGSSVNLTCSSVANPEADNYTWYKRTDSPSSSSWLQVGWGQVLSLPSVEASHTGRYLCQTSNSVGEGNSTDLLVTMKTEDRGSQMHLIIAGVGVIVLVTLVVAHLLYWKKRTRVAKKRTAFGAKLSGEGLSSSATEDQLDTVYANIQTFPSSRPRNTDHKHYVPSSDEAELIYTTVAIKPRNSRAPQESRATIGESEDSVIYSTVVKSS